MRRVVDFIETLIQVVRGFIEIGHFGLVLGEIPGELPDLVREFLGLLGVFTVHKDRVFILVLKTRDLPLLVAHGISKLLERGRLVSRLLESRLVSLEFALGLYDLALKSPKLILAYLSGLKLSRDLLLGLSESVELCLSGLDLRR